MLEGYDTNTLQKNYSQMIVKKQRFGICKSKFMGSFFFYNKTDELIESERKKQKSPSL